MTTLTEFLLARIAERESAVTYAYETGNLAFPILSPAEMLADLAAKRRIVGEYLGHLRHIESRGTLPSDAIKRDARIMRGAVRHLAAIYADHPDYREEWKP